MIIRDLCVSFGDKKVLSCLCCDIEGLTCITGPSGCGKTTLLRCIAGLMRPDSGSIQGMPERPAFMFQEDRLFPWYTVLQNVMLVTNDREKAVGYLQAVELGEELDSMPADLSGGMRRRVSLARTLAYGGDMLILDEPFKGMDVSLVERLVPLVKRDDIPVIITTHSPTEQKLLGGNVLELKTND